MIIGINASFIRKPDSGMGQVTINFLRKLMEFSNNKDKIILYLEEDIDWELPTNFEKKVFLPSYKRDDLIRKIWWEKFLLPKKAKQDHCDVFISLYQSATILKNIRHIMLVHDAIWKIFPQYLNNLRKKIYYRLVDQAIQKADQIVTVSEHSKEDIEKVFQIPAEKILANHIDCAPIFKQPLEQDDIKIALEKYQLDPNQPYIFYIGGFDVRKNVARVIQAYASLYNNLQGKVPDLVLSGSFHPHLVPLVTDLPSEIEKAVQTTKSIGNIREKIAQVGFVPQSDLPALYHQAQMLCYPSLYEGFGLPPLEAFNCGCLVVTSKVSSLKEIADEQTALIVDPEDTNSIAQAMQRGLEDQTFKEKLLVNARIKAQQFSWEKFTQNLINLI